ncbi:MAG: hypothetical protein ABEH66_04090 [Halobacteriales archaeon]
MSLEDLNDAVEATYGDLDDELSVELGREAKHELAMLLAALDGDEEELVGRAIHLLFQTSVDTAKLDFHLRSEYGVTYDEYLSGMTFEEMTGGEAFAAPDDDRRYQF